MKNLIAISLLIVCALPVYSAQNSGDLYAGLLPALPPNQEVVIQEITLPPGRIGSAHRHDAYVYVYVLEGELDMQVAGGEITRVRVGEVFVESPDDVHIMSNNSSSTQPARFLAILIKDADKPVVLPAN